MATASTSLTALATGDLFRYDGTRYANYPYQYMIVEDIKAINTAGGSANGGAGFHKHDLTSHAWNNIGVGANLSSSVITLPAGTYTVDFSVVVGPTDQTQYRFRNTSDGIDVAVAPNMHGFGGHAMGWCATGMGGMTITGSKTFELQYHVTTAGNPADFGYPLNAGGYNEKYATVIITKV
jgi:hypothetical protein